MELSPDQIRGIIKAQIEQWSLSSKDLEIAIKVHTKIGSEMVPGLVDRMTKAEKAISELESMLKELDG
jgi:hypothetical protein